MRVRLNDLSKIRARINNFGKLDFGLVNHINKNLKIVFNSGGNIAGLINEKANTE